MSHALTDPLPFLAKLRPSSVFPDPAPRLITARIVQDFGLVQESLSWEDLLHGVDGVDSRTGVAE